MTGGTRILAALAAAWLALAGGAATAAGLDVDFAIMRDGEKIGTHTVTVGGTAERRVAETRVKIVVRIAFVPFYRKSEFKREVLEDGRLISYDVTETTNGTTTRLTARLTDGKMEVSGTAGNLTGPPDLLPETYWNVDLLTRDEAMDSTTGEILPIAVEKIGPEQVEDSSADGGKVRAMRYRMTGGFERDLWYDENGRWVRMELTASDGSRIVFRPRGAADDGD